MVHNFSADLKSVDYLDFTYAKFQTKDFELLSMPNATIFGDPKTCRYQAYTNGQNNNLYWKVLAARLTFIIVFQNIVACLQQSIDWAIPDIPEKLDNLIKRENYLVSNKMMREEKKKMFLCNLQRKH